MEVTNKNITHNYEIKDRFEAGLILTGAEVKSCKLGQLNFRGAYCTFGEGFSTDQAVERLVLGVRELYIKNFYIAPYLPAKREQKNYNPYRPRKLLLNRRELRYLSGKIQEKGATIIPLKIYTKNKFIKIEIAVVRGLKKYDKREKLKKLEFTRRKQKMTLRL